MVAAEITGKYFNKQTAIPVVGRFLQATTSDWTVVPYPGVAGLVATLPTGGAAAITGFGTVTINNDSTAYTALSNQIVIKSGAITRKVPYYLQTSSGELIYVYNETAADNAASTLDVIRGCLGTTASLTGLADDSTLYIKNYIIWGANGAYYIDFSFVPMPWEPKGSEFL